jgi:chondroitin AC lyase
MLLVLFCCVCNATAQAVDELQVMRERYVTLILPAAPEAGQGIIDAATRYVGSMRADGTWPDIDYQDQERAFWKTEIHLQRVLQISKACRLTKEPDERLQNATAAALNWWLEHDPKNPNWWFNEIGIPQLMGEIGILLRPRLTPQQRDKISQIMQRGKWTTRTGQNLVWLTSIQVMRGLIENAPDTIDQAYKRMYEEIRVEPIGKEGIQADFSFHQHGSQFYSGGYGLGFGNDVSRFVALARGTRYQIPADKMKILESYLLDGQQWMIRGQVFDYSAVGRELTRAGKLAVIRDWGRGPISPAGAAYGLENSLEMLADMDTPRRKEFERFASRLRGEPNAKPLSGNRYFWCSDYMAHHRPEFFVSIRMFSDRLLNTEIVNNEGRKSHHLADGATYIYRSGDEYRDIFPAWDWTKVPGTTAIQTPLEQLDPKQYIRVKGETSFVGGVSDGQVGLAAMDLKRGPLAAKKAWLCLDDAVVFMGAGITCTDPVDVVTTVNQCLLNGVAQNSEDGRSIRHDGIGYVFADSANVQLKTGAQRGSWADIGAGAAGEVSKDLMLLYIDHGRSPRGATYQYVISFRGKPDIRVLSNTPTLQAASGGDVIGAVFWEPGKLQANGVDLEVDQACLVLARKMDGEWRATLSNPTQKPLMVKVKLNGSTKTVELRDGLSAASR